MKWLRLAFFPNISEMALKLPDDFIKIILDEGRKKRNANFGKHVFHAVADFLPFTSFGITLDSQQRRALDYLAEQLQNPTELLEKFNQYKKKVSNILLT